MIIVIWFVFGYSEYEMTFFSIYNAKQCSYHVNYLVIKFIVFLQVKLISKNSNFKK